jgi:phosphatidylinositol-3,4,5-trisphosphate 3-phosphatase/dual-specificity protein phosphatase PTEN
MVEFIPLHDHNPPKFDQIEQFCASMQNWLSENPEHVAVVHCKAGKGRTGTMISCYYIYSKKFDNPFDAMDEFSRKRCKDSKVHLNSIE